MVSVAGAMFARMAHPSTAPVQGKDVEAQTDAMADAAGQMAGLLTRFARAPGRRSMDSIAVFHGMSRAVEALSAAAAELRRQEWLDLDDEEHPEFAARWAQTQENLDAAATMSRKSPTGWI